MVDFTVHALEGTHYVDVHLANESFKAESGAFCYAVGDVTAKSSLLPSFGGMLRALMAEEKVYRPTYSGTGVVTLESTLGGFHVLELKDEEWILEPGTYWASEHGVDVSFHRERMLTSIYAGQGLIYLQTKVRGTGKVVVQTRGPVELIQLEPGKSVAVDGQHVVCRTGDVNFSIRRSTRNFWGRFTSGEGALRVYEGKGQILLNPSPYWRYQMAANRAGAAP